MINCNKLCKKKVLEEADINIPRVPKHSTVRLITTVHLFIAFWKMKILETTDPSACLKRYVQKLKQQQHEEINNLGHYIIIKLNFLFAGEEQKLGF